MTTHNLKSDATLSDFRLSRQSIARRVARDIPDGSWVNLGIGMPTDVADCPMHDKEVILHCENGVVGVGPRPDDDAIDPDLINAGKMPITLVPGGSFMSHADSFALIRGGHLDLAVLGAYQVSIGGDLANWTVDGDDVPAVGGAMDLAVGARAVWVMMNLFTSGGACKIVGQCSYALTARSAVQRVYTDHGTFQIRPGGVDVIELAPGLTFASLSARMPIPVRDSTALAASDS